MRKLVITLLVLAVLLVLVDRAAKLGAEGIAGSELRTANGLNQAPDVDIAGFPFLTQFASGHYPRVSATAGNLRVGSSSASVRLSRVRVQFHQVTASKDFRRFSAERATARATITYHDLGQALGISVAYDGTGRVRATKTFRVLGQSISPTVSVKPVVANQTLSFTGSRLKDLPDAPPQVVDAFASIFGLDLPLKKLPFHVTVTSLEVDRSGVQLRLAGRDLRYTSHR